MRSRSVDPVPLPPPPSAVTLAAGSSRHALNRAEGTLSFDLLASAPTRRLRVLWLENRLDCGLWSYYCELRNAMAELHELCTPSPSRTCLGEGFAPDVAVVGPRFSINIPMPNETLGFARSRLNRLPLLIIVRRPSRTAASAAASAPLAPHASRLAQHASRSTPQASRWRCSPRPRQQNKMYTPNGWREIVGSLDAKLSWAKATGAVGAFTWIHPGRSREFSRRSGVAHHWLPFAFDPAVFARHANAAARVPQPIDVGFTGASGLDKYPQRAAVLQTIRESARTATTRPPPRHAAHHVSRTPSLPASWRPGPRALFTVTTCLRRAVNVSAYLGTWMQMTLNRKNNQSWKALSRKGYARTLASTKVWVSTTGPSELVGTRYYEVLASGTTLLLCNAPASPSVYDGLFEEVKP